MYNKINEIVKSKKDLFIIIKELDNKGLMCGSSGNISVKIDEDTFIITSSGIPIFNIRI